MHIMHVCMTKTVRQRDRCCCSFCLPESAACKMSRFRLALQRLMTLIIATMFLKWNKRSKNTIMWRPQAWRKTGAVTSLSPADTYILSGVNPYHAPSSWQWGGCIINSTTNTLCVDLAPLIFLPSLTHRQQNVFLSQGNEAMTLELCCQEMILNMQALVRVCAWMFVQVGAHGPFTCLDIIKAPKEDKLQYLCVPCGQLRECMGLITHSSAPIIWDCNERSEKKELAVSKHFPTQWMTLKSIKYSERSLLELREAFLN